MKFVKYFKGLHPVRRYILIVIFSCFAVFYTFCFVFPLPVYKEYSAVILDMKGNLLNAFLTNDDKWRMYTELDDITPELGKAIIYKEDKYFYIHPGINPFAVVRAVINNIRYGKRTSGASTITMQVARMLEPKERTIGNKIIEMFRALQIEVKFSKKEILQLYLNMVPYGGNIEGVKSASVIYFGKMPNHLSIAEIATLSIIPNRPVSLRLGLNNDTILYERNKWLDRYKKASLFDTAYINDALQEPLNAYRRSIPRLAPHLSYRLKSENNNANIIRTNIDPDVQFKAEKITRDYSRQLYFRNIKNAITLIIDNETCRVRAYVGSADFFNNEDAGQVDGIRAVRSPGSTLKPLLYAMAMDRGIVTPKTIITDVPVSFGGYEPENYDEKYHGNVTVEYALATSLNIPAVKVLDMMHPGIMAENLALIGFNQIKADRDNLGLSLILGGCGVTLEELTSLYCCIANRGIYRPPGYTLNDTDTSAVRVISESAAFMITEILTLIKRPDLPVAWENSVHMPKIAWKTGTSYGRRDAWSIGYNSKYTIGVWAGNFSGEGVPELNGADIATPLLFRLFNAIDYDSQKDWYKMPDELHIRYVCSKTGCVPGKHCNDETMDYFIPGVSDNKVCDHIKEVYINPDSTISYCTSCLPELGYKVALYENYPPEIITWFNNNNINYKKIPPHNPECERLQAGSPPRITSPVNEVEYYINLLDTAQIKLSCHTSGDVNKVYWYINKKLLKEVNAGEDIFFTPKEGMIEISCSDDKGRNSNITIYAKYSTY